MDSNTVTLSCFRGLPRRYLGNEFGHTHSLVFREGRLAEIPWHGFEHILFQREGLAERYLGNGFERTHSLVFREYPEDTLEKFDHSHSLIFVGWGEGSPL